MREIPVDRESVEQPSRSGPRCSPRAARHNLPQELTSFIGRSAELARVRDLLEETRVLTLVGAGGVGKTRLALRAVAGVIERFPDGVWWVELAAVEDERLLAGAVSSALGLRERPGKAPLDLLLNHLSDRRVLLVLDNCEHLLGPCAALADALLGACGALVLLATSREELRLLGELRYRVPSLTVPAETGVRPEVTQSEATRLFVDRAGLARPTFVITDDNAAAVGAICRKLDGIPLAIELAAARVRMLSPERIAKELDDRFRLLTGGARSVAPRHDTLRASIDWSHELCSEEERILLRRLSVWAGGFTLDGAESVSADEVLSRRAVLEPLTGLVDKYLVDTEEHEGEIRFRMLETIRQYAAERLVEADEVDATHARHLAWCLELAEDAERELVRHDAAAWLSQLEQEAPNLRAALEWALANDADSAPRLAAALTFFWLMRGHFEEGTAALARVLEVAPRPSAARGKVRWGLAYLNVWRHQFDASLSFAESALEDGEAVGDRSVKARALTCQGQILAVTNPLRGRRSLARSLELARESGDEWCTAEAMRLLASSHMRQSEHDRARPLIEEGYALARALGYRPLYAWYFDNRARGELEHGRLQAARELAEQAAAASSEIGDPVKVGFATALLVECDVLEGHPAAARTRAEPCIELTRKAGAGSAQALLENALALVDLAEGFPEAARRRIEATLPVIDAGPAYEQVARARRGLAYALLLSGDLDGAFEQAQLLLSHAESARNEHVEATAYLLLGRVALERAQVHKAEAQLHDALAIAARRDFRLQTLSSLDSLARVAALTDSPTEAARLLAAVWSARARLGLVRWPPEGEVWQAVEEGVRAALGEDGFARAWSEGGALSLEEAVGYASRARGERKRPSHGWESLTPTELEVVRHAAAGLTNPQIGERMFVSRATVKAHLSHIFAKLGTSSRFELAAEATRRGLDAQGTTDPRTR